MTIVVGYIWTAPPKEASVDAEGRVTWTGARRIVGDTERVAIEFAKQLSENAGDRLIGVSIGDAETTGRPAANAGLACGLDEAILVTLTEPPDTADAAAALAAVIGEIGEAKVVVLGSAASDSGTRMMGPYLGGLLNWPVLTDVTDAGFTTEGIWAVSEIGGTQIRYLAEGAVVLCVSVSSKTPRQMGLRDIMAAGKKPCQLLAAADLPIIAIKRHSVTGRAELDTGTRLGQVIPGDDPDQAAGALYDELLTRGLLK